MWPSKLQPCSWGGGRGQTFTAPCWIVLGSIECSTWGHWGCYLHLPVGTRCILWKRKHGSLCYRKSIKVLKKSYELMSDVWEQMAFWPIHPRKREWCQFFVLVESPVSSCVSSGVRVLPSLVGAAMDQPKAALGASTAAPCFPPSYTYHKPQKSLSSLLADNVYLPFSS